jgi:hypothetical protein
MFVQLDANRWIPHQGIHIPWVQGCDGLLNPVHILTPYLYNIRYNINFPFASRSPKWSLPFGFNWPQVHTHFDNWRVLVLQWRCFSGARTPPLARDSCIFRMSHNSSVYNYNEQKQIYRWDHIAPKQQAKYKNRLKWYWYTSCSGSFGMKPLAGDRLFQLIFMVLFSLHRQIPESYLRLSHDTSFHSLSNSLFINQQPFDAIGLEF